MLQVSDFDSVECDSPILPPKKSRRQQRALFEDDSPIPVKRAMTSKRMLTIAADVVCDEDDEFTGTILPFLLLSQVIVRCAFTSQSFHTVN